ncbi:MAG: hypothetical protein M3O33_23340, partial [Cyanobacteriota bacterium]|nr:hypothetical protein [Cyanobacteriota bacterium]
ATAAAGLLEREKLTQKWMTPVHYRATVQWLDQLVCDSYASFDTQAVLSQYQRVISAIAFALCLI